MKALVGLVLAVAVVAVGCSPARTTGSTPSPTPPSTPLGPAEWWVDPAQLPLPESVTTIHGFLLEEHCASGQSPEGRIAGPDITYRPDAVVVTFHVHAIEATVATCQANPRYPVTIELGEPLGRRTVVDGSSGRDATVDPTIVLEPSEDCGPLVGTDDAKSACYALIETALGDRFQDFARAAVMAEADACAGDVCTTVEGIAARRWVVDGTDRQGQSYTWRCSYREEAVASCEQTAGPSPS